jgi:glycerol-3-phosphate cytidylyltransferase
MKIGFTCGAMDLLHAGHILMLEDCKLRCDYLIVGLHTNPQLDRPEKNKPVQSVIERYIQLKGCEYVDEIVPYETEADLIELLKALPINTRFVGSDWKDRPFTGDEITSIEVKYNTRDHDYSSSDLRKRISEAHSNK